MHRLKTIAILGAAGVALSAAGPVSAHHSAAMFDRTKTLTLEGTVKAFQWTNPHIWIQLEVKDPKSGKPAEWSIEGASTSLMSRTGWKRLSMKPGDKAIIEIYPLRAGGNGGSLKSANINGVVLGSR